MNPKTPYEYEEQIALADLLTYAKINFFHIPNGAGKFKSRYAHQIKRMGLKAGIPDLMITSPPPLYKLAFRGVFVEMKRQGGRKPTAEQLEWHEKLKVDGYKVIVAYGFDDAVEQLKELGYKL